MSTSTRCPGKLRIAVFLAVAVSAPILLTQCRTPGGTYRDVKYDPAKLKTPAGHGLEKKEYPFDDDGKYRKDWVKANASGRAGSSYPQRGRAAASSSTPAPADDSASDYPTYAEVSAPAVSASAPDQPPAPPAEEPAASPQYHKVATGDTLFALARRYATTVDELKRVNGLSGDSIHVGQSLRLP